MSNDLLERIASCASKDETRPMLCGITQYPDKKIAIACDGYRAMWSGKFYIDKNGKKWLMDASKDAIKKGRSTDLDMIEDRLMNFGPILPHDDTSRFKYEWIVEIPEWFTSIKSKKNSCIVSFDFIDGTFAIGGARNKESVHLNAIYMGSFAGQTVRMFSNGGDGPILLLPLGGSNKTYENEWGGVVMPIKISKDSKLGDRIMDVIKKPTQQTEGEEVGDLIKFKAKETKPMTKTTVGNSDLIHCEKCKKPNSLEDFSIIYDAPASEGLNQIKTSGQLVCPEKKCGHVQEGRNLFDQFVEVQDDDGDLTAIITLNGTMLEAIMDQYPPEKNGEFMSVGSGLMNSLRKPFMEKVLSKKQIEAEYAVDEYEIEEAN